MEELYGELEWVVCYGQGRDIYLNLIDVCLLIGFDKEIKYVIKSKLHAAANDPDPKYMVPWNRRRLWAPHKLDFDKNSVSLSRECFPLFYISPIIFNYHATEDVDADEYDILGNLIQTKMFRITKVKTADFDESIIKALAEYKEKINPKLSNLLVNCLSN